MRKLKLQVEALAVESFESDPAPAHPGTVRAHDDSGERLTPLCTANGISCNYSCVDRTACWPDCATGYPDSCWISWDPAARCAFPQ